MNNGNRTTMYQPDFALKDFQLKVDVINNNSKHKLKNTVNMIILF